MKERSLNFVVNFKIYNQSTRQTMAAILNAATDGRFINMPDVFWRERLSSTSQWTKHRTSGASSWYNLIIWHHVSGKRETKKAKRVVLILFCELCPFMTLVIMALHIFLFLVTLTHFCFFAITPITGFAVHSLKHAGQVVCYFLLSRLPSILAFGIIRSDCLLTLKGGEWIHSVVKGEHYLK